MRLRIEVHQANPLADLGESGAEIDGGGGLADAAFLIHQSDTTHRTTSVWVKGMQSIEGNFRRKSAKCNGQLPPLPET